MRILVLTSTYPRWQADTVPEFIHNLCKNLVSDGLQVEVLAPHYPGASRAEIIDGVKITRYRYFLPENMQQLAYGTGIQSNLARNPMLYFLVPFFIAAMLLKTITVLKKTDYDYIHAHWLIPQGVVAVISRLFFFKQNRPGLVCTAHGSDVLVLKGSLMSKIRQWVIKNCNRLNVVSNSLKNILINEGTQSSSITVLPMGVDFKNVFFERDTIHRKSNRLLFVGRFIDSKGIIVLINAFIAVVKVFPETELYLVGDGPLKSRVELIAGEAGILNKIIFAGYIQNKELPFIYSSAKLTIFPSYQEGLGLVPLEAMGCGSVVVASKLDAICEVLVNNETGILVNPGDARQLADAIIYLLKNPDLCNNMALKARQSVISKYDWNIIATSYVNFFNRSL